MSRKKDNKNSNIPKIISSLVYIVIGIIMIIFTEIVGNTISYLIGAGLTIYGLFSILTYFIKKEDNEYSQLIIGILSTAFGIFAIASPGTIIKIIPVTLGIIIIIDSLIELTHVFKLKAFGMNKWWINLIITAVLMIFGFTFIFFADLFGSFLVIILGIILALKGLLGFAHIALVGHYAKNYNKDSKMIDVEARDID